MVDHISENFSKPDIIAGVATGGIAIGALVAEELGLPFVYVRSEPKKHGLGNQIEGVLESGQSVVVIEDLISTGGSSLQAVKALREAGARVIGMVAIFSYGFPEAKSTFEREGLDVTTLTDYSSLIEQALALGYVADSQLEVLSRWNQNPKIWSEQFSEMSNH